MLELSTLLLCEGALHGVVGESIGGHRLWLELLLGWRLELLLRRWHHDGLLWLLHLLHWLHWHLLLLHLRVHLWRLSISISLLLLNLFGCRSVDYFTRIDRLSQLGLVLDWDLTTVHEVLLNWRGRIHTTHVRVIHHLGLLGLL